MCRLARLRSGAPRSTQRPAASLPGSRLTAVPIGPGRQWPPRRRPAGAGPGCRPAAAAAPAGPERPWRSPRPPPAGAPAGARPPGRYGAERRFRARAHFAPFGRSAVLPAAGRSARLGSVKTAADGPGRALRTERFGALREDGLADQRLEGWFDAVKFGFHDAKADPAEVARYAESYALDGRVLSAVYDDAERPGVWDPAIPVATYATMQNTL